MPYPKRLIEVDLPIRKISEHARREKSIRHGHISTLHIWWARRPLAACRAVLCAALWPDPADDLCPQAFRDRAAELVTEFARRVRKDPKLRATCDPGTAARWVALADLVNAGDVGLDPNRPEHLNMLRHLLLDFIADFANWDNSTQPDYLETSRALTQAAHEALGGEPGTRPLVVDPFAGGGSIPLEALRVGADAFASDLNPVAVLLNKVVLEYIPRHGRRLAEEVRRWGEWVKERAAEELRDYYPTDPDGAIPIAYLWARTITCEGPGCGAEVPLMRSLWLAKKGRRSVAVRLVPHPPAPSPQGRGGGEPGGEAGSQGRGGRPEGPGGEASSARVQGVASAETLGAARELRQRQSPPEEALWERLRGRALHGLKFRREHPIDRFVLDFYCDEARLAVEVDGGHHEDRREADEERDQALLARGIRTVRIPARTVLEDIDTALEAIERCILTPGSATPSPTEGGRGGRGVRFEIIQPARAADVGEGTVRRGAALCPCCGYTTPVASVRQQLRQRRGGAADARLFCVVTTRPGEQGRHYRLPTDADLEAVHRAAEELERRKAAHTGDLSLVPEEPLPLMSGVFNVPLYGMETWADLFSPRQLLALTTLARLTSPPVPLSPAGRGGAGGGGEALAEAVQTCLALAVDRQADHGSSLASWAITRETVRNTFGRQALPMVWDFCEANPWSGATGGFDGAVEWVARVCEANADALVPPVPESSRTGVPPVHTDANRRDACSTGHATRASATAHPLPDDAADVFFTDPPYYNSVPYADLSDFFYHWLRRTVGRSGRGLLDLPESPKGDEIAEMAGWDPVRYPHKDGRWFESRMAEAMAEGRRVLGHGGIGAVVFAHKTTSGWEALLAAMLEAGWTITASWPIDTEMATRLRARDSAALASSIHLVCRPREGPDGLLREEVGDWRQVLSELPQRIHEWMPRLREEGVVGADAIFACLGPALEIFSRYSSVEKASGEVVTLSEYLEHVWAAVAREALSIIFEGADASGFEEDARLTAMWLWTVASGPSPPSPPSPANGGAEAEGEGVGDEDEDAGAGKPAVAGYSLEYDAARKIAQGLGAHLEQLGHVVEVRGETARLLPVRERQRHLFGSANGAAPRAAPGRRGQGQLGLFAAGEGLEPEEADLDVDSAPQAGETTLDRVHQSMLLFHANRSEALRRFLVDDGAGRDERFWRLAQALSALYPMGSDEKRWVDGVLARKKGLGL